jgi:hypothetical protein
VLRLVFSYFFSFCVVGGSDTLFLRSGVFFVFVVSRFFSCFPCLSPLYFFYLGFCILFSVFPSAFHMFPVLSCFFSAP